MGSRLQLVGCFVVYLFATCLYLASFFAPHWLWWDVSQDNLPWWSICSMTSLCNRSNEIYIATVFMLSLGLAFVLAAGVAYILEMGWRRAYSTEIALACQFAAGVSIGMATLAFHEYIKDLNHPSAKLDWAFWLTIPTAIMYFINGVMMIFVVRSA